MFMELCCCGCQPTVVSALAAFSWMFFLGLYGPAFSLSRAQVLLYSSQSLNGTPSRPTVQSRRGSTGVTVLATNSASESFQDADDIESGSPAASTLKAFTRFCVGSLNPQHAKWLGEYGKLSRSPWLAFAALGSPSFAEA